MIKLEPGVLRIPPWLHLLILNLIGKTAENMLTTSEKICSVRACLVFVVFLHLRENKPRHRTAQKENTKN